MWQCGPLGLGSHDKSVPVVIAVVIVTVMRAGVYCLIMMCHVQMLGDGCCPDPVMDPQYQLDSLLEGQFHQPALWPENSYVV